jgi:branched-chain amino acid transport system substrate-binding protein
MKKLSRVVLTAAAVLALTGCASRTPKEWTIPFLNALTGSIAAIGEYLEWGAERAAAEINEAGGIQGRPVKIVAVDTGLDPQKGASEMARLARDSLVTLGPVPEAVIEAALPIAVNNGMPSIPATASFELASRYFPWSVSWFPPTLDRLPPVVKAWVREFTDVHQVVQLVVPYGAWPGMADAHESALQAMGVKVLPQVDVPDAAVAFGSIVRRALAEKPDAVILALHGAQVGGVIRELRAAGWKKMDHILIFSSADDADLYAAGGRDLNGAQIYNYINPGIDTPRWNAFKAAYLAAHPGSQPPSLVTNYYDAVYMIKEAIEKTGVTGSARRLKAERRLIADYLQNVKGFHGIMFDWDMEDGVPTNKPTYLFRIQDGQKLLVQEVTP